MVGVINYVIMLLIYISKSFDGVFFNNEIEILFW